MIDEDRVRARRMVTQLAEFLRYALVHRPLEHSTLAEELEAIESYLAIEKIRFEDRLAVASEIDRTAAGAAVPAFLCSIARSPSCSSPRSIATRSAPSR